MVHHYSDLAPVLWNSHLPLGFRKSGRKCSQCRGAGLETNREGFGPGVDSCSRRREASLGDLFVILLFHLYSSEALTVTRKNVAGIEVPPCSTLIDDAPLRGLLLFESLALL